MRQNPDKNARKRPKKKSTQFFLDRLSGVLDFLKIALPRACNRQRKNWIGVYSVTPPGVHLLLHLTRLNASILLMVHQLLGSCTCSNCVTVENTLVVRLIWEYLGIGRTKQVRQVSNIDMPTYEALSLYQALGVKF